MREHRGLGVLAPPVGPGDDQRVDLEYNFTSIAMAASLVPSFGEILGGR